MVVLDNDTAAVRAMVGGFDYGKAPFNLATNGQRQPGSSFKPFTLITALSQGHSTAETFTSAPQEIPFTVKVQKKNGKGNKEVPELFDVANYNDSYLGSASLVSATTFSDNSVYAQLGTQVGLENVAATAEKLGIETDLASANQYAINGQDYQPYNPAMILGGLSVGVTPLEMAHAYSSIAADGNRISGTMAADAGGPVGINRVVSGDELTINDPGDFADAEPVEDQTGANGENKVIAKQVIDPAVATTARDILETVVTSGTGKRAATGEPTWGKTGTTDDNGDAWFCGATKQITACVWVGHAESNTPMVTEFGGAPVDGGTIPAEIFADIVNEFESLQAERKAGQDTTTAKAAGSTATPAPVTSESAAPAAAPAPSSAAPAPAEPAQGARSSGPAQAAPPAPASGGGGVSPG